MNNFPARKILVVDDNPVILEALSMALKARGYDVFVAIDGPEAFATARREKLDLILLDILFPPDITQTGNTWDGFLIIDWLHRIGVTDGVPIVVISGAEPEKFKNRCLAAGAAAFLSKPVDIPLLLDTIRGILGPNPAELRPEPAANFAL